MPSPPRIVGRTLVVPPRVVVNRGVAPPRPNVGPLPAQPVGPGVSRQGLPQVARVISPEPPIPREPPAGLRDSKEVAAWIVSAIHAHEGLRTRSFYDTGHLIARLLEMRDVYRAANIKELCAQVDLGLSHMTANKYLQVARTFPREVALLHGVEKCYALTVYAKAIGRAGQAARILEGDETIRGAARGTRSKEVSAAKLYAAVRALKDAAREEREPTEVRAVAERAAVSAEKLLRSIGVRGANAALVRRGGAMQIAVYFPIDVGEGLESALPKAIARFGVRLAKTKPELFEPLREAGWRVRAG